MNKRITMILAGLLLMGLMGNAAWAVAVTVSPTYTSDTLIFSATVSSQCDVVLPTAVAFAVTDTAISTQATAAVAVTIDNIIMPAGKSLRLSLAPDATTFTPPVTGVGTWASSDLSWDAGVWDSDTYVEEPVLGPGDGTGAASTMSGTQGTYATVATSVVNGTTLSTPEAGGLVFHLAGKPNTIARTGVYTLHATWKVEVATL